MREFRLPPRSRWEGSALSLAVQRVRSGDSLPTFWDNLSVPSSRLKDLLRLLTHENGTTKEWCLGSGRRRQLS
jgi:hypothetical protein